jgi:hypothetical protein
MKTQILRNSKLVAISFALAVSFGVGSQVANAETIEVPVSLTGDVVRFVETNRGAAIGATGDIFDASGHVVGVVYGPNGKVVHEVSGDKIVVIKERGDTILSASLYNRLFDLQNLLVSEKALGHISADKYDALYADLKDARAELDSKVSSGGLLAFDESIEIGSDLDTIASRLKTEITSPPAYAEVVYRPMVIVEDPAQKRIAIYRRTVTTSDGVTRTTKTTTTEKTQ